MESETWRRIQKPIWHWTGGPSKFVPFLFVDFTKLSICIEGAFPRKGTSRWCGLHEREGRTAPIISNRRAKHPLNQQSSPDRTRRTACQHRSMPSDWSCAPLTPHVGNIGDKYHKLSIFVGKLWNVVVEKFKNAQMHVNFKHLYAEGFQRYNFFVNVTKTTNIGSPHK